MKWPAPLRRMRRFFNLGKLDCADVVDLCSDYVDEALSPSLRAKFRYHLESCQNCNGFVATLRATVLTLKEIPNRAAPPDLQQRINERIAAEATNSGRQPST